MTEINTLGPAGRKSAELMSVMSHDGKEYRFYEFPNGDPRRSADRPGQIKAYVVTSRQFSERRVRFEELPTVHLQEAFIKLTGRTAKEVGVTIMQ